MSPNEELPCSTVAEVTKSSKGSFRINATLALPTCIAYIVECTFRHHLANVMFPMFHKMEQQQPNNKSANIQTGVILHADLCSMYCLS